MLQDAFIATMIDPEFLADAKNQNLSVESKDGAFISAMIQKIYATPRRSWTGFIELIR